MKLRQKLAAVMAALMVLTLGSTAVMAEVSPGADDYDDYGYAVDEKVADGIWFVATGTDSTTPWLTIEGEAAKNLDASLAKGFAYSCDKMTKQKTATCLEVMGVNNGEVTIPQTYMAKMAAAKGWFALSGESKTTGKLSSYYFSSDVINGSKAFTLNVSVEANSKVDAKLASAKYDGKYSQLTIKGTGNLPGSSYVDLWNPTGSDYTTSGYVYYYNTANDCFDFVPYSWNNGKGGNFSGATTSVYSVDKCGTYVIAEKLLPDSITSGKTVSAKTEAAKTTAEVKTAITAAIANAKTEESKVVKAEIPAGVKVSKDSFKEAKEAGVTLVIESDKNNVKWSFKNMDKVNDMTADFTPEVKIGDGVVAAVDTAVAKTTSKTLQYTQVSFDYDGILPGATDVTLDLSAAEFKEGSTVYLYYYNETTKAFELTDEAVYAEGFATFTMTHCSDYIVTNEKLATTAKAPATAPSKAVKTGDVASSIVYLVALLAGMGLMVVASAKKRA